MADRSGLLDPKVYDYVVAHSSAEPAAITRLREATAALGASARMQIGPDQVAFMGLLVRAIGARRILEIGTFTGTSALAMALALPDEGRVVTCDVDVEVTTIAQRAWVEAGVASRIELRLGPALRTLDAMIESPDARRSFDLAFIDADKGNYEAYWERCLELVRPGGLIAIDNVLWSGRVADPSDTGADTEAIRRLNRKVCADRRASATMLSAFDGLTIATVLPPPA